MLSCAVRSGVHDLSAVVGGQNWTETSQTGAGCESQAPLYHNMLEFLERRSENRHHMYSGIFVLLQSV